MISEREIKSFNEFHPGIFFDPEQKSPRAQDFADRLMARIVGQEDGNRAEEEIRKENIALREEIIKTSMFEDIVGNSPPLQQVLNRVEKGAPTDSTVLITGETGTGKELIARAIHKRSKRSNRAFVSVNCAAIPPSLIPS